MKMTKNQQQIKDALDKAVQNLVKSNPSNTKAIIDTTKKDKGTK
jgi:hypothetical protein